MNAIGRRAALAWLCLVLACGGRRVGADQPSGGALEEAYPAVRWVPASAAYAVVAARVDQGLPALRELAELVALAQGAGDLDALLRGALGASPLDPGDLGAVGIDLAASAAVFAVHGEVTAVLPVGDAGRLDRFLADRRAAGGGQPGGAGGATSWPIGEVTLSAARRGEWLLVHAGADPAGAERIAAASPSLAADPLFAAAVDRGARALGGGSGRSPGLVGLVRVAALAAELGDPACAARAAQAAPHLLWAADAADDGATAWAALDLSPDAAAALRAEVAEPPPPGFYRYRSEAALSVDWSVDLAWLEEVRASLACPRLARPIEDPVRAATGFAGPRGWHLAATAIDLDEMSGAGALHLVLSDPALIRAQLEAIPGRSLFERTRRIAGTPVRVLSVPGLPSIAYRLDGPRFTVAVGDGVMDEVLGPGTPPAAAELGQVAIRPARLGDLTGLLGNALGALSVPSPRERARSLAARLSRYEDAGVTVQLDRDSVAIFARMRIRREGAGPRPHVRRASMW